MVTNVCISVPIDKTVKRSGEPRQQRYVESGRKMGLEDCHLVWCFRRIIDRSLLVNKLCRRGIPLQNYVLCAGSFWQFWGEAASLSSPQSPYYCVFLVFFSILQSAHSFWWTWPIHFDGGWTREEWHLQPARYETACRQLRAWVKVTSWAWVKWYVAEHETTWRVPFLFSKMNFFTRLFIAAIYVMLALMTFLAFLATAYNCLSG